MIKDSYTTFEIGDICQVSHTTVINWIDRGQLSAYKTPGKHRRVRKMELLEFMDKFEMPIPPELKQKKRVLAVDDDPAILKVLKKAFARLPMLDFQMIGNGIEALVSVGRDTPDLMLLDVMIPGMDGIHVCRSLAENPDTTHMKIIVITGKHLSDEQEKFLSENADAVLSKPFSTVALIEKTRSLLGV